MKENVTARTSPLLTLNNGVQIPAISLGVFQSPPEQTADAVESALTRGYRLVDTAAAYFNETQIGEGLRRTGIDRAAVFVQTKVWISTTATTPRYTPSRRAPSSCWLPVRCTTGCRADGCTERTSGASP